MVEDVKEHCVECRRSAKDNAMRVAYENIRMTLRTNQLTKIVENVFEDDIAAADLSQIKTTDNMKLQLQQDIYHDMFGSESDTGS